MFVGSARRGKCVRDEVFGPRNFFFGNAVFGSRKCCPETRFFCRAIFLETRFFGRVSVVVKRGFLVA